MGWNVIILDRIIEQYTQNYRITMNTTPQIRLLLVQGEQQTVYTSPKQKPRRFSTSTPQAWSTFTTMPASSTMGNHCLKLKDYIRLATITKRSNSNSAKKDKSPDHVNNTLSPVKNQSLVDTKKSLSFLKEELMLDVTNCSQKISDILAKIQKGGSWFESTEDEYDELVFMCELHRLVKENIMTSLEKASNQIAERRQQQMAKFSLKARGMIGEDIKKSITAKKRSALYNSNLRSTELRRPV